MDSGNAFTSYLYLALERSTFRRAVKVALLVGIILNLINHPHLLLSFSFEELGGIQIILTFLVPYFVSTYSSVSSNSSLKPGKTSHVGAVLQCKSCKENEFQVQLGQQLDECTQCKKETRWKPVRFFSREHS